MTCAVTVTSRKRKSPRSATAPGSLAYALERSVENDGYRFAYSGPFQAQQEPCGTVSVVWWPAGKPDEVTPRLVPLEARALRGLWWTEDTAE